MSSGGGPWIRAALFCDQVIEGKDGVLTLVRVVDHVSVEAIGDDAPEALPPGALQTTLVVMLISDSARGPMKLTVRPERPDGQQLPPIAQSVPLSGEDRGVNVVLPLSMQVEQSGLYWFDILLDDVLATRVPLRVSYRFVRPGG